MIDLNNRPTDMTDEFSFMLKPSTIVPSIGIGVFATHRIRSGIKITVSPEGSKGRRMQDKDLPEEFKKYCSAEKDDWYLCPQQFNRIEIGWYVNHSFDPNIEKRADSFWYTLKEINSGDEILFDYNTINEPEDKKEIFYKK